MSVGSGRGVMAPGGVELVEPVSGVSSSCGALCGVRRADAMVAAVRDGEQEQGCTTERHAARPTGTKERAGC